MILPCSQVCTQLAAGSLNILIRCLVADQTLTVEHLCAITLCTLDPVAHPLAVAPAIRAEQSDLLASNSASFAAFISPQGTMVPFAPSATQFAMVSVLPVALQNTTATLLIMKNLSFSNG